MAEDLPRMQYVPRPEDAPELEDYKLTTLERWHTQHIECVIDCDVDKQTVTFNTNHGRLTRQHVEVYTRVMGYHRPVEHYNRGKRAEHGERKYFREDQATRLTADVVAEMPRKKGFRPPQDVAEPMGGVSEYPQVAVGL